MRYETPEFLLLLYEYFYERLIEVRKDKRLLKSVRKYHTDQLKAQLYITQEKLLKFSLQDYGIEIPDGICGNKSC